MLLRVVSVPGLGLSTHEAGSRLQKAALLRSLRAGMKKNCRLKRSYKELETAVLEAGGSPVHYARARDRSVRRRMSKVDMEAFLAGGH